VIVAAGDTFTAHNVSVEASFSGLMKRDESAFLELGFANQQAVGRQIVDPEGKSFRDPQSSHRQQSKQCAVGVWPERTGWTKLGSSLNELADLRLAEDVRYSTCLSVTKSTIRWYLMPIILDLKMTRHSNNSLEPMIALAE
jgi:hypothetical protein